MSLVLHKMYSCNTGKQLVLFLDLFWRGLLKSHCSDNFWEYWKLNILWSLQATRICPCILTMLHTLVNHNNELTVYVHNAHVICFWISYSAKNIIALKGIFWYVSQLFQWETKMNNLVHVIYSIHVFMGFAISNYSCTH